MNVGNVVRIFGNEWSGAAAGVIVGYSKANDVFFVRVLRMNKNDDDLTYVPTTEGKIGDGGHYWLRAE